jgi:hypothetical protein
MEGKRPRLDPPGAPTKPPNQNKFLDWSKIVGKESDEIHDHFEKALEKLDELKTHSTLHPELGVVYHEIVNKIKADFCEERGEFNTLFIGGSMCGAGKTWKQKHHSKGIGELRHGDLSKRGYSVTKGKTARHRALKKVVRAEGPLSTFRKLNAVSTYTKNTSKTKSKTFKRDRNWIKKTFMDK